MTFFLDTYADRVAELRQSEMRRIMHEYGEPISAELQVYTLNEIVAEKLLSTEQERIDALMLVVAFLFWVALGWLVAQQCNL